MTTLLRVAGALALVFVSAVIAELPPSREAIAWIQAREWPLMLMTSGVGVLGFTLMMGGILTLLMDQDQPLTAPGVEDVERSVRVAARPVAWRASSYRVRGRTAGGQASEQFTFGELKHAWKTGRIRHERRWRRRVVTMTGALMFAVGLLGALVVFGPGWVKVLLTMVLLYGSAMTCATLWRA